MIDVVIEYYFRVRRSDWVFGCSYMSVYVRILWQYGYLKVVSGTILKYRENSMYRGANKCIVLNYLVLKIACRVGCGT